MQPLRATRHDVEIEFRVPGEKAVDKSIQAFCDELGRIQTCGCVRPQLIYDVDRGETDVGFLTHRLDISIRTQRRLLAGQTLRASSEGDRQVAVIVFVPKDVQSCTFQLAA